MKIAGMLRVRNEARWIRVVLASLLPVCDHIYVMDDHSNDGTPELCRMLGKTVTVWSSPFEGLDEARDKSWLLERIHHSKAEWILAVDGDEVLHKADTIWNAIDSGLCHCYALQVLYLWNGEKQVRTDGVYGRFWRPSLFRRKTGQTFRVTQNGGNFHCGNVPQEYSSSARCSAQLLHYGYMIAEDRKRKFAWYNQIDPHNVQEQQYLHMIQGDPGGPPAGASLRHAGPLTLSPLQ